MFSFFKKTLPVSENEPFIHLVRAAQEDPAFAAAIRKILNMDAFNRGSVINTWLDRLRFEETEDARNLMQALLALRENEVAHKLREILDK